MAEQTQLQPTKTTYDVIYFREESDTEPLTIIPVLSKMPLGALAVVRLTELHSSVA